MKSALEHKKKKIMPKPNKPPAVCWPNNSKLLYKVYKKIKVTFKQGTLTDIFKFIRKNVFGLILLFILHIWSLQFCMAENNQYRKAFIAHALEILESACKFVPLVR